VSVGGGARAPRPRARQDTARSSHDHLCQEIGTYGVNVAISDRHNRGIYPWSYLETLAARPKLEDFLIN
jgi:DUF971 family protein